MNDYLERLLRVVQRIEDSLMEDLSHEKLAADACLSVFHFERVFHAMTGESVFSYVRKRKLSRAFDLILGTESNLIDIALQLRYESAAAFSRAFKNQFRITPSRLRMRRKKNIWGYFPPLDSASLLHRIEGGVLKEPRIVASGPLSLMGLSSRNTARKNSIPGLWFRFISLAKKDKTLLAGGTFGVYIYDFHTPKNEIDQNMEFEYLAACKGPESSEKVLSSPWKRHMLPQRTYAVFEHRGYLKDLGKTYDYIYGSWFPKSGHEGLEAEHFEYHGPDFKGDFPDSVTEIWIPIRI